MGPDLSLNCWALVETGAKLALCGFKGAEIIRGPVSLNLVLPKGLFKVLVSLCHGKSSSLEGRAPVHRTNNNNKTQTKHAAFRGQSQWMTFEIPADPVMCKYWPGAGTFCGSPAGR